MALAEELRTDRARRPRRVVIVTGWIYTIWFLAITIFWYCNPFVGRSIFGQIVACICALVLLKFGLHMVIGSFRTLKATSVREYREIGSVAEAVIAMGILTVVTGIGFVLDGSLIAERLYELDIPDKDVNRRFWIAGTAQFLWWITSWVLLIVRAIAAKRVITGTEQDERDSLAIQRREAEVALEWELNAQRNRLTSPTQAGTRSQYDADQVKDWPRPTGHDLMFGSPGAGLESSGFNESKVAKGQLGELNFAKTLAAEGMLDRFATFWSIHIPDEVVGWSTKYSSDIDCVIVTGRSIWVIDLKYYMQGDITWKVDEDNKLVAVDNQKDVYIGQPRSMSRNMEMADSIVKRRSSDARLPHNVTSRVVFMPTNNGSGSIFPGTTWTGNIPVCNLSDVLELLREEPPVNMNDTHDQAAVRMFKNLLKEESYWASVQKPAPAQQNSAPRNNRPVRNAPASGPSGGQPTPGVNAHPSRPSLNQGTHQGSAPTSFSTPSFSTPRNSAAPSSHSSATYGSGPAFTPTGSGPTHPGNTSGTSTCPQCHAPKPAYMHACPACGHAPSRH